MTDKKKIRKEIKGLYDKIDLCIGELVKGRATHNETLVANAQHKLESLMVQTQQVLSCINDAIEEPVSEDLEEERKRYTRELYHDTFSEEGAQDVFDWDDVDSFIKETAIYFANWQKEQMMKDAIDGVVICDEKLTHGYKDIVFKFPDNLQVGDKVKLIIIKED